MANKNCLTCEYIAEELAKKMQSCDTDREFYEAVTGATCYCDKVGGKINIYGVCTEGGIDYIDPDTTYLTDVNSSRGISYRRNERAKHIARKKRICHAKMTHHPFIPVKYKGTTILRADLSQDIPGEWYEVEGKYDKGKIHCGCPICKPYKGYLPSWKDELSNKKAKLKEEDWLSESSLSLEDKEQTDGNDHSV